VLTDLRLGDCYDVLRTLPEASVDAVVTDPPYGLSFMGKRWDYDVPSVEVWAECLRVLKPGGHLLAFAGTRTQHRMAVRIEDAGFDIRDMIAWVYGSGFPKSLDVSKAIDNGAGAERKVIASNPNHRPVSGTCYEGVYQGGNTGGANITEPATDAARQWQGWGTALKPALEPITVARKPLVGTVAANVLEHGTGALNVDGCRVAHGSDVDLTMVHRQQAEGTGNAVGKGWVASILGKEIPMYKPGGRWPANLIHDGSEEVVGLFPQAGGGNGKPIHTGDFGKNGRYGKAFGATTQSYADTGSAARFFYCAKASKADRGEGNAHPTVKPTDLMRYLCRLVTPPGGLVLDPFMGSGSTGKAAVLEGFRFLGIEREESYLAIAKARIDAAVEEASKQRQGALFAP